MPDDVSLADRRMKLKPSRTRPPSRFRVLGVEALERRELLAGDPLISEMMAANTVTLLDADGDSSDWIEVHNPAPADISLAGWFLTDDAARLDKWRLRGVTGSPEGY